MLKRSYSSPRFRVSWFLRATSSDWSWQNNPPKMRRRLILVPREGWPGIISLLPPATMTVPPLIPSSSAMPPLIPSSPKMRRRLILVPREGWPGTISLLPPATMEMLPLAPSSSPMPSLVPSSSPMPPLVPSSSPIPPLVPPSSPMPPLVPSSSPMCPRIRRGGRNGHRPGGHLSGLQVLEASRATHPPSPFDVIRRGTRLGGRAGVGGLMSQSASLCLVFPCPYLFFLFFLSSLV